jgi:hypothetical protein
MDNNKPITAVITADKAAINLNIFQISLCSIRDGSQKVKNDSNSNTIGK